MLEVLLKKHAKLLTETKQAGLYRAYSSVLIVFLLVMYYIHYMPTSIEKLLKFCIGAS